MRKKRDTVAVPRSYLEFCIRQTPSKKHRKKLKKLLKGMDGEGPYGLTFEEARK